MVLGSQGHERVVRPPDAVELATELLVAGVDTSSVLSLAMLPTDPSHLDGFEVDERVRSLFAELGVSMPRPELAAWTRVRDLAEAASEGGGGAASMWSFWRDC